MKGDEVYLKHILDAIEKIETYMGVDLDAVWGITQKDLPNLKKHVQVILDDLSNI